jgi:chromosome segregation ATPase
MSSPVLLLMCLGQLAASSAFVIGRNNPGRIFIAGSSTSALWSINHKESSRPSDVDESEINGGEASVFNLNQELQEKDLELEDLRAEMDSMSALLQQKEHQGRQFNEYYPLFCEQMAEKNSEIEELKQNAEDNKEKLQDQKAGESSEVDPNQYANSTCTEQMATKDSEIKDLSQKIQDYQMQLAFSSHDLAAKHSEVEDLTQQLADLSGQMMAMGQQFTDEYVQLQEQMELEMNNSAKEVDQLRRLVHHLESKKIRRKEHPRLDGFDVSDQELKPNFLGTRVKPNPDDVIKWD